MVALVLVVGTMTKAKRRGARPSAKLVEWSDHDMRAFIEQTSSIGLPLEAALLVYTSESGLDPTASSGLAWGIPQLTQIAAKQIGWTRPVREFATLTVAQQAPWIAKLQAAQIRMIGYTPKDALELYVANLSPKAAKARSEVIYREGTDAYAKNANLDRDHKGYIAAADLKVSLNQAAQTETYKRAVAQLRRLNA
jgi:hypothetical protein